MIGIVIVIITVFTKLKFIIVFIVVIIPIHLRDVFEWIPGENQLILGLSCVALVVVVVVDEVVKIVAGGGCDVAVVVG